MAKISHSEEINAPFDTVWKLLLDKAEHPDRTIKEVESVKILERYDDGMLREMKAVGMTIKERIRIDEKNKLIKFDLVENPMFTGYFINKVDVTPEEKITLTYEQNWTPLNQEAKKMEQKFLQVLINAVKEMKNLVNTKN